MDPIFCGLMWLVLSIGEGISKSIRGLCLICHWVMCEIHEV